MVTHRPRTVVVNHHILRQLDRLCKVDEPNTGVQSVVHEQQRAPDNFVGLEKVGAFQGRPYRLQSLNIFRLQGTEWHTCVIKTIDWLQFGSRSQMNTHNNVWKFVGEIFERVPNLVTGFGRFEVL